MYLLLFIIGTGCSSPEKEAADIALLYASAAGADSETWHKVACAEDREAQSLDELNQALNTAKVTLGSKWSEIEESDKKIIRTVKSTTLTPAKDAGDVVIELSLPKDDKVTAPAPQTIHVRKEGEAWCVSTGWAETKRTDAAAQEIKSLLEGVVPLINDWKLNEAEQAIADIEAKLSKLSDAYPLKSSLTSDVSDLKTTIATLKDGWVGGRWRVEESTDPMTDQKNVVITLKSVDGLPNVLGDMKPATIIVRCKHDKLDVYVATSSMLDYNYEYDSISGRHRFDSASPEKITGTTSSDRSSIFLRNPRGWIDTFRQHDGGTWLIELPIYNRTPATAKFNLTAATAALKAIPDTCK